MSLDSSNPSWAKIADLAESMDAPVMLTVVGTSGSTPRKLGARLVFDAVGEAPKSDGDLPTPVGTIGGGAVEAMGLRLGFEAWAGGGALIRRIPLGAELGMCCGGTMTIMAQPLIERPTLLLFGLGHVGSAVARIASECDLAVIGLDPRPELVDASSCWLQEQHADIDPETIAELPDGTNVHVMIMTHDHALDQELVEALIQRPFGSLQMLGSKRKALRCRQRLQAQGHADAIIDRLISPAGLNIAAETPAELAVALVGDLIRRRRG